MKRNNSEASLEKFWFIGWPLGTALLLIGLRQLVTLVLREQSRGVTG